MKYSRGMKDSGIRWFMRSARAKGVDKGNMQQSGEQMSADGVYTGGSLASKSAYRPVYGILHNYP